MIEETIQKLTASIDALTAQLSKLSLPRSACAAEAKPAAVDHPTPRSFDEMIAQAHSGVKIVPPMAVAKSPAFAEVSENVIAEAPKPKKTKKPTFVEAPLDTAAAPAPEPAAPAPAPAPEPAAPAPAPVAEPKLPEQKDVIDIAGQLLVATNQNDGGFLKNLAKELGLDKLRNAKPEQRQSIIDRIKAEIERVKGSAA